MQQEQIVVSVSPVGDVTIEASGFQGNGCAKATEQLEIVLGGGTAKKKKDYKPEFSLPANTANHHKNTF